MIHLNKTLQRARKSSHISFVWAGTGAFIAGSAAHALGSGTLLSIFSLGAGTAFGIGIGKLIDGSMPDDNEHHIHSGIKLPRPPSID